MPASPATPSDQTPASPANGAGQAAAVETSSISSSRKSVLAMSHDEAKAFFLKGKSYCNFDLPTYFEFDPILNGIDAYLTGKQLPSLMGATKPKELDDLNHVILNNKDGKFAWRPFQLIHPVLYVALVHAITREDHWRRIKRKFQLYAGDPKHLCLSLPLESTSAKTDKAEQVLQWWQDIEQQSIVLSLDYEYVAHTDIADCYGSIYTHSIPWALHGQEWAKKKENRDPKKGIGNIIDFRLREMSYDQTNGIPQGSILMDFIAEMVLGYADSLLTEKLEIKGVAEYKILRYRDDYRVFTHNPVDGETILQAISEVMHDLGMKLQPTKTGVSDDVVKQAIKPDKIAWIAHRPAERTLQKQLIAIHEFSREHGNSGSLMRALAEFHRRLLKRSNNLPDALPMIAMVVDMAVHNPKIYPTATGIISKLLCSIDATQRQEVLQKIQRRFSRVPNTGHLQLWLQRIAYPHRATISVKEPLCQLVLGQAPSIWNNEWIGDAALKALVDPEKIVNRETLEKLDRVIQPKEVQLFDGYESMAPDTPPGSCLKCSSPLTDETIAVDCPVLCDYCAHMSNKDD